MNETEMIKYYYDLEKTLRKTKDVNVIEESMKILDHPEKINEYFVIDLIHAICHNPITTESILQSIFTNSQLPIMSTCDATKHENFPVAIAQDIVVDQSYPTITKIIAIRHPHFSEEFLINIVERLSAKNNEDMKLLNSLCQNPNFSNNIFKKIIEYNSELKTLDFIDHKFYGLLIAIKETKDLNILKTAVDNDVLLRSVADNKKTTTELLRKIVEKHINTQGEMIDGLMLKISQHKNSNAEILDMLKNYDYIWTRTKVALHKNTSIQTLEYLSKDSQANVRKNVSKNKNTPESILHILKNDKSKPVRENALKNIQNR